MAGNWLIAETFVKIDPDAFPNLWNERWLKAYATALIKKQWGQNLLKFEGMQLPGGVMINGRQLYEDALVEIDKLEEDLRLEHEDPIDFFVG